MATAPVPTFTTREKQVGDLLCTLVEDSDGIRRRPTLAEIGAQLGIAPATVKVHANTLRLKLRVKYRREIPQAYAKAVGE